MGALLLIVTAIVVNPSVPTVPGQTDYTYDFRGRLVKETRADNDRLDYAYDVGGNRTDVQVQPRTAAGSTWKTHYDYDGLNRLKTVKDVRDPNGTPVEDDIAEYFYDAVGNLGRVELGNGTAVVYGYDDLHRLRTITNYRAYGLPEQAVISAFTYTLGKAGNRTQVVEQFEDGTRRTVQYTYDALYRLTRETSQTRDPSNAIVHERTVDYTYDDVGNRETMAVVEIAGGVTASYTVTYDYDAHDRLITEERSGTRLAAARPADDGSRYAWSGHERHLPSAWAGVVLLGFGGATLMLVCVPFGTLRGGSLGRSAYRRRLWTACVGMFFVPQFMVGAGTLLDLNTEALEAHALAATSEEYSASITYVYTDAGTLHQRIELRNGQPFDNRIYEYDAEDRLVAFDPAPPPEGYSAQATFYTYDHDGVRTSQTTGTATTYYLVDKNRDLPQVLEERDEAGVLKVRYIYGHDLLAQVRPKTGGEDTWYYHYDGQLSTRQLTDEAATPAGVHVTRNYAYDAFGADLANAGLPAGTGTAPAANAYRYTGEHHDSATGFYYLRARYYDPATGRFASRDPFGGSNARPLTLHKYLYCNANPVDNRDPSGLFSMGETLSVTTIQNVLATSLRIVSGILRAYHMVTNVIDFITTIKAALDLLTNPSSLWLQVETAIRQYRGGLPSTFLNQFQASTLRRAASDLAANSAKIFAKILSFPRKTESIMRLFRDPRSVWMVYLPTPEPSSMPSFTFPTPLPHVAGKAVYATFGPGGTGGRLMGIGLSHKTHLRGHSQFFRMDWHGAHPKNKHDWDDWASSDWHYHIPKD